MKKFQFFVISHFIAYSKQLRKKNSLTKFSHLILNSSKIFVSLSMQPQSIKIIKLFQSKIFCTSIFAQFNVTKNYSRKNEWVFSLSHICTTINRARDTYKLACAVGFFYSCVFYRHFFCSIVAFFSSHIPELWWWIKRRRYKRKNVHYFYRMLWEGVETDVRGTLTFRICFQ